MRAPILGVTGRPVLHSMSPVLFRELFRITGREAAYLRVAADGAEEALALFRALDMSGMNVTAPFKDGMAALVPELSREARELGACNCVLPSSAGPSEGADAMEGPCGALRGRNTDPAGVLASLAAIGAECAGKRCLVIGSGGAGAAAAYALACAGGIVTIANRTIAKAEALAARLGCEAASLDELPALAASAKIIVSTLASSFLPEPASWLSSDRKPFVLDADYKTGELARYANSIGLQAASGTSWLIGQALPAYELFMGPLPEGAPGGGLANRLAGVLAGSPKAYSRSRPIALVGLMGAGKSSVGRKLAGRMGLPFVDSDDAVQSEAGATVASLFDREGEAAFRSREARVIDRITSSSRPLVLSLGGGALSSADTARIARERCTVLWLYVSPRTALERVGGGAGKAASGAGKSPGIASRPLLASGDPLEKLKALEEERRFSYASSSDLVLSTEGRDAAGAAERLYEEIDRLS